MSMKQDSIISSDKAPEPVGPYPHARKVGNLLFLSGVGPRKKGAKEIPGVTLDENKNIISYNIEEQCHSVFQNVKFILEASGSKWENLIDITVYLTNMKNDLEEWMEEKNYNSLEDFKGKLSKNSLSKNPFVYKRAQYVDLLLNAEDIFGNS